MSSRLIIALSLTCNAGLFAQNPPAFPGAFRFQTLQVSSLANYTPLGLNDQGDTVGKYVDANNLAHGVRRNASGDVTIVDIPGALQTILTGINNDGQIIGIYYLDRSSGPYAFLRQPDGTIVKKNVPGAISVNLNGINNLGRIVGAYDNHALIFEPDGSFNFFDVSPNVEQLRGATPGAIAYGINDAGVIVGSWQYYLGAGQLLRGCFIRDANGTLIYPSSCATLTGINNLGLEIATDRFASVDVYLRNSAGGRVYVAAPGAVSDNRTSINAINNSNGIAGTDTAGNPFTATPCSATITPSSQTISASGGTITVQVTAEAGCTSGSGTPWDGARFTTALTSFLTGSGAFAFDVPANTTSTAPRTETIYVAGNPFTLTQAGGACVVAFKSSGTSVAPVGGSGSTPVTAPDGCSWTAVSSVPWLQITSGAGSGNGAVAFTVATNPTPTARTGSITLRGGESFFVNQGGNLCTFTVTADNISFTTPGGPGTVNVATGAGCPWTASSSANWITISTGLIGNGSGSLTFAVAPNTGGNPRSASLSVAGTIFNVTQDGSPVSGMAFVPVTPCRLMDTRPSEGKSGVFGPPFLSAGTTREIPVPSGGCGIPSTARAYSINVTVVPHRPLAYLTMFPTGQPQPNVSTLNAFEGQIIANAAIVPAGTNGSVSVFVTDDTELILDVNGYFTDPSTPGSLVFYPIPPCRLIDTRAASGGASGAFGPPSLAGGQARSFPIRSSGCNVPPTAGAYVFNITVVPVQPLDYIAAWPTGQSRPLVSVQNSPQGRVLANAAIVPAGTNGDISLFAPQATDVVVDINGYFAPPGQPGGLRFYPVNPCRIADTRPGYGFTGTQGPPVLDGQTSRLFPVTGFCGVSTTAKAFSLNLTVVPPGYLGFVTLYPGPQRPFVSTLNAWEGQVAANAAIVPADATGGVNAYVSNSTQLVLDVNGYFAP